MKKASLFDLFWTFFKIGAFTFGGGYAMISMVEREVVSNKKWSTSADIMDMLVIAESTPGVFAVNMATYTGFRQRGRLGSIIATLGVILPSFLIILALSFAIEAFQNNKWYKSAFYGIQICVCTLILNAFLKVSKSIDKDIFSFLTLLVCFGVALFTNFNVIFLIIIGAVLGVFVSLLKEKSSKNDSLPQLFEHSTDTTQVDIVDDDKNQGEKH